MFLRYEKKLIIFILEIELNTAVYYLCYSTGKRKIRHAWRISSQGTELVEV